MTKVAIIGTGIAGLGCAHFLREHGDLTLYEQNDYVGGHTNTVTVPEGNATVAMDTGFMVFNHVTYPHLTRLFRELDVATKPTSMSFSVQHLPSGMEYCGSSLNHLFAQRRNLLRPRFWKLLSQINRFNGEAVAALNDPRYAEASVGEYVAERKYGEDFLQLYLVPMSSAVWSTPPDRMRQFPIVTLLRFFHNHGFLGLHTQHPWFTVVGGAKSYVEKITAPLRSAVKLNAKVATVRRESGRVEVVTQDGNKAVYDKVILASHADQSLRMLADADVQERRLLAPFSYQPNQATLHTDSSLMPRTRLAWASWNYRIGTNARGEAVPSTIYWMNSLQGVSERENYFVSINGEEFIRPEKILRRIAYHHPLFDRAAIRAQPELPVLNRQPGRTVFFCGSYFKYGFHEDAFASALDLCRIFREGLWN